MQFVTTHDVTVEDVVRAVRLTRRWPDVASSIVSAGVIAAVLSQVLYSFLLYLRAAAGSLDELLGLLRFEGGATLAAVAWLSVLVTLFLPVFLFHAVRVLADTLQPARRARRLVRESDLCRTTTYTIDDSGVRSSRLGGPDVFLPWSAFDTFRSDAEMAVLLRGKRLVFFVPLQAFGAERALVLAHLKSNLAASRS